MWRWTWKSMLAERLAFGLAAVAVAGAFTLVLLFEAVFAGEAARVVGYPQRMAADVWVMQKGVSNMHMASSLIWDSKLDRVRAVEGVRRVTPILYLNATLNAGERDWFAYVIGLTRDGERAGPWAITGGRGAPSPGEIVLPEVVGRLADVRLGDRARLADRDLVVIGFSAGTFSMANSVAFVAFETLREIMALSASYSYLLVDLEEGRDATEAARRVEADVSGVHAMTADEFIANDRGMALQMGVDLIRIMTAVNTALAIVLTAFAVQAFLARKTPDLIVIGALGARTRELVACMLGLAATTTMAGMVLATGFCLALAWASGWLLPQMSILVEWPMVARLTLLAGTSALCAAAIAVYKVARIDPAAAFRI
jgi:putative ABC transport system permease protein